MKRITKLMVFAGAMLAASCSENEIMEVKQNDQIFFRTEIARQTRATSTTVNTLGAFNITAWKDDPDPSNNTPVIENAEFVREADVFKGSGSTYYWPKGVDVKFYAYAPKASANNGVKYVSATQVDIEPLADTDNQVDLLYASNTGNKAKNAISGVTLNFRHTMSQIQVKVKNSNSDVKFKVTGWRIAGVDGSASFVFDDASNTNLSAEGSQNTFSRILWQDNDDDYSASYSKTFGAENVTGVNSSWGTLSGSAILIPQDAAKATAYSGSDPGNNPLNGAYIAVQYQALDADDNELAAAGTWGCWPVHMEWDPGFRYIYTIDLADYGYKETGTDELEPISDDLTIQFKFVDVEIDEWQPEDDNEINVPLEILNSPYLRFHTTGGTQKISIVSMTHNETVSNLEYSLDGINWDDMDLDNEISFGDTGAENIDVYVRGKGFYNDFSDENNPKIKCFRFDDPDQLVECSGCVGSLTDYDNPTADLTVIGQYCALFYECQCLTTAPSLPSETLTNSCYKYMFYNCTKLTSAPELPATDLVEGCYVSMFQNCSSLSSVKALFVDATDNSCEYWLEGVAETGVFYKNQSATWKRNEVYIPLGWTIYGEEANTVSYTPYLRFHTNNGTQTLYMAPSYGTAQGTFSETKLEYSVDEGQTWTELPLSDGKGSNGVEFGDIAGNNVDLLVRGNKGFGNYYPENHYNDQKVLQFSFKDPDQLVRCSGTIGALTDYNNPAAPLTMVGQYSCLFDNCTCLRTAPDLPATVLSDACYEQMFYACENLRAAPSLPATVMTKGCYRRMFGYCHKLLFAPALPSTQLADDCYEGMFEDCDALMTAPSLPATTLAFSCYNMMFYSTGIVHAPALPATKMEYGCYYSMFGECYNLLTAPELPAMTLANDCYYSMFSNCQNLQNAPDLPATILESRCYDGMFFGCNNISRIKMMGLRMSDNSSIGYAFGSMYNFVAFWLEETSPTGTFIKNSQATWDPYKIIPDNWTVETADE